MPSSPYAEFLKNVSTIINDPRYYKGEQDDRYMTIPGQNKIIELAIRAFDQGVISKIELTSFLEEFYEREEYTIDELIGYYHGTYKPSALPKPDKPMTEEEIKTIMDEYFGSGKETVRRSAMPDLIDKEEWIPFDVKGKTDERWGYTDREALQQSLDELLSHVGESVLVYGGGGPGAQIALLRGGRIETWKVGEGEIPRWGLKPDLLLEKPTAGSREFDPWLDSWAIAFSTKSKAGEAEMEKKEPWQMTREEFLNYGRPTVLSTGASKRPKIIEFPDGTSTGVMGGGELILQRPNQNALVIGKTELTAGSWDRKGLRGIEIEQYRKYFINKALSEGKPVPPEVLKDYPELVEQAEGNGEPLPERFHIIPHYSPVTNILTSFTVEDPDGVAESKQQEYNTEINKLYPAVTLKELDKAKVQYFQYRAVVTLGRASFTLDQLRGKPAVKEMGTTQRLARYGVPEEDYEKVIEMDRQFNLDELRNMCRDLGLATGGDKKKLISRLMEAQRGEQK